VASCGWLQDMDVDDFEFDEYDAAMDYEDEFI
jgi:hypothetical protein